MIKVRRNTTANLKALDVRSILGQVTQGAALRLGSGNFGQTYKVFVGRQPYVVKIPVDKDIHGRPWKIEDLRAAFQAEIKAANTLNRLGHTVVPRSMYVEVDGLPVIVREYGEPTILTQEEYDDLSMRLRSVVNAGWAVEDELLVLRRPNRSLFVADVGLWHPYNVENSRDRSDAQTRVHTLIKSLGTDQTWSKKQWIPSKAELRDMDEMYNELKRDIDDPDFLSMLMGDAEGDREKDIVKREQAGFTKHNPATARRTDPALWNRIVAEVTAGDKGGRPGQWSARKAQLAVALYQKRGGGYVGPKTPDNALAKWAQEQWRTRSGRPSLETGERYLPSKALAALSPQEYGATTRAKRAGMARGQQFVPQPERIAMKTAKYRRARRNGETLRIFAADGAAYFQEPILAQEDEIARKYKAKEAIVFLSPDDFLRMAKPGEHSKKASTVLRLMEQGERFDEVPFLRFQHAEGSTKATVVSHEGRHRARALKAEGVRRMPVVLTGPIRWDQQMRPTSFDYEAVLPHTLFGQEEHSHQSIPMPIPIHYPEIPARTAREGATCLSTRTSPAGYASPAAGGADELRLSGHPGGVPPERGSGFEDKPRREPVPLRAV
jgi:hypothetical protein